MHTARVEKIVLIIQKGGNIYASKSNQKRKGIS